MSQLEKFQEEFGPRPGETIFDRSVPGRRGEQIGESGVPHAKLPSARFLGGKIMLPEVSEPEVLRHYVGLSGENFSIESGFYPLGSCTMKYNPRRNAQAAAIRGFAEVHPGQPVETMQGALAVMWALQAYHAEIMGMKGVSLAPMAGAHGELAGMLMIKARLRDRGDLATRRTVLVPDSAHGTNPASAAMAGFEIVSVESGLDGNIDIDDLSKKLGQHVAAMMFTLPSTLGLFEQRILEVTRMVHEAGGLVYGDGANMNALLGRARLGDLGFDVAHINTHKAESTPHGGGGPGAGPVSAGEELAPYLPAPIVVEQNGIYSLQRPERSIGRLGTWYGNFAVLLQAYAYLCTLGEEGLREVSGVAVLNANYLMRRLLDLGFEVQRGSGRLCMHEFVLRGALPNGIKPEDFARRLMDYGIHAPTIEFPAIEHHAVMIEPTETESQETLDAFVAAMLAIKREAEEDPEVVRTAPHSTVVGKLNQTKAVRFPVLRWKPPAA